jgi:hypothetical protein
MTVRIVVDVRGFEITGFDVGVHCDWHDRFGMPHTYTYSAEQLYKFEEGTEQ